MQAIKFGLARGVRILFFGDKVNRINPWTQHGAGVYGQGFAGPVDSHTARVLPRGGAELETDPVYGGGQCHGIYAAPALFV